MRDSCSAATLALVLKSVIGMAALALVAPFAVFAADSAELTAGPARALAGPPLNTPANDASVNSAPVFTWQPVRRAAKYEFQLSADSGFRSIITGGSVDTMNTATTLERSLPDGGYHWRVRAVNASDNAGRWSRRGIALFRVRPRARGNVRVRADKRGFRPGAAVAPVR
jgi:hypothetical protein